MEKSNFWKVSFRCLHAKISKFDYYLLNNIHIIDDLDYFSRHWPDAGIAEQMEGQSEAKLECLSAIFVNIPEMYGTR